MEGLGVGSDTHTRAHRVLLRKHMHRLASGLHWTQKPERRPGCANLVKPGWTSMLQNILAHPTPGRPSRWALEGWSARPAACDGSGGREGGAGSS